MDFHDEPFYGKEDTRNPTCYGQAKKGTTHIVRIATAYVIWRQVRLTLVVRYVLSEEDSLETLTILWKHPKTLGFFAKVLYLDNGFASTAIMNHRPLKNILRLLPIRSAARRVARVPCVADAPATKPCTPLPMIPKP